MFPVFFDNCPNDSTTVTETRLKYISFLFSIGGEEIRTQLDLCFEEVNILESKNQVHLRFVIDRFYSQMADLYFKNLCFSEGRDCISKSVSILDEILEASSKLKGREKAEKSVSIFGSHLGLDGIELDNNNTCILGIDDEFSLHITYEPNSNRLYLYSPLLDGLPHDTTILEKLYETLLVASVLGGQLYGGGVGVATGEELILIHVTISLEGDSDIYELTNFAADYVEMVEHFRRVCDGIVKQVSYSDTYIPKKTSYSVAYEKDKLAQLLVKHIDEKLFPLENVATILSSLNWRPDKTLSDQCFSIAKQQLIAFGEELSLNDLVFDENYTCILGIDDMFSLHLTFEPTSCNLYLYSPLLDGFPERRLDLYEHLLIGNMLGGQMAGGGCGIALTEQLVLMHCRIKISPTSPVDSLVKFAPLYVETVEKWRQKCASKFPEIQRNYKLKNPSISQAIIPRSSFFRRVFEKIESSIYQLFGWETMIAEVKRRMKMNEEKDLQMNKKKLVIEKHKKHAQDLFNASQYQLSSEYLDFVLVEEPDNTEMLFLKALSSLYSGRPKEALVVAGKLKNLKPNDFETAYIFFQIFSILDQRSIAHRYLEDMNKLNPTDQRVLNSLHLMCIKENNVEDGLSYLNKLIEISPNYRNYCRKLAILFSIESNEFDSLLEFSLKQYPGNYEVHHYHFEYLKNLGRYEEAFTAINCSIDLFLKQEHFVNDGYIRLMDRRAALFSYRGYLDEANKIYDSILMLPPFPATILVLVNKALLLCDVGRYDEALELADQVRTFPFKLEFFPYDEYLKSYVFALRGNVIEAMRISDTSLTNTSAEGLKLALDFRWTILNMFDMNEKALKTCDEYKSIQGIKGIYTVGNEPYRCISLSKLGKSDLGLKILEPYLQRRPRDVNGLLAKSIALLYHENFDISSALDVLCQLFCVNPNHADGLYWKGRIHLKANNPQVALKCFEETLSKNPYHLLALASRTELILPSTISDPTEKDSNLFIFHENIELKCNYDVSTTLEKYCSSSALISLCPPKYADKFKANRTEILNFITNYKEGMNCMELVGRLLSGSLNLIDKAILIDALEFPRYRLNDYELRLSNVKEKKKILTIANRIGNQAQKFDEMLILSEFYVNYLQMANRTTNSMLKKQCELDSDLFSVLIAALKQRKNLGSKWEEKIFFSISNMSSESIAKDSGGFVLYDHTLSFLENIPSPSFFGIFTSRYSLESLWKTCYGYLTTRFNSIQLENEEKTILNQKSQFIDVMDKIESEIRSTLKISEGVNFKSNFLYLDVDGKDRLNNFTKKEGTYVDAKFNLIENLQSERFVYFDSKPKLQVSGLVGSTFFGSDKPFGNEKTLILDAMYQYDSTSAISDGLGHFSSAKMNKNIYEAAYRAVKLSVRYCNLYKSPFVLFADIPKLIRLLGSAVRLSFPSDHGTASLLFVKVFDLQVNDMKILNIDQNKPMKCVVGGSVGDCLAFLYSPSTNTIETILRPRQFNRGSQYIPYSITEDIPEYVSQRCFNVISENSLLFKLTDGAWQLLPVLCNKSSNCFEYYIDKNELLSILKCFHSQYPNPTVNEYRDFLLCEMQKVLNERKTIITEFSQVGRQFVQQFEESYQDEHAEKTLGKFLSWLKLNNDDFLKLLIKAYEILDWDLENITITSTLDDFKRNLKNIRIGDDIAFTVELLKFPTH